MDPTELHQFIRILAVAIGALVACPIVLMIAELGERTDERRRQRRTSTQHPVMQY